MAEITNQTQAESLDLVLIQVFAIRWKPFWQNENNLTGFVVNLVAGKKDATPERGSEKCF